MSATDPTSDAAYSDRAKWFTPVPTSEPVRFLTQERVRQGLSMGTVAKNVGVAKSSIHDWEHGIKSPSADNLNAWAGSLGYRLALVSTSDAATDPGGETGLREALADALIEAGVERYESSNPWYLADAQLAGPLARLVAERDEAQREAADLRAAVQRVEALLDQFGDPTDPNFLHPQAASLLVQLRAALAATDAGTGDDGPRP